MTEDYFTDEDLKYIRRERAQSQAREWGHRKGQPNPQAGLPSPQSAPAPDPIGNRYGIEDDRDGTREKAVGYWARVEAAERQQRNRDQGLPYDTVIRYEQGFLPEEKAKVDKSHERHERALQILRDAHELFEDCDVASIREWSRSLGLNPDERISYATYKKELAAWKKSGCRMGDIEGF